MGTGGIAQVHPHQKQLEGYLECCLYVFCDINPPQAVCATCQHTAKGCFCGLWPFPYLQLTTAQTASGNMFPGRSLTFSPQRQAYIAQCVKDVFSLTLKTIQEKPQGM